MEKIKQEIRIDNADVMPVLFGKYDANAKQIEQALGVPPSATQAAHIAAQ